MLRLMLARDESVFMIVNALLVSSGFRLKNARNQKPAHHAEPDNTHHVEHRMASALNLWHRVYG